MGYKRCRAAQPFLELFGTNAHVLNVFKFQLWAERKQFVLFFLNEIVTRSKKKMGPVHDKIKIGEIWNSTTQ